MRLSNYLSAAAVLAAFSAPAAIAATATGSFNVQVIIQESCTVTSASSTLLDFGTQGLLNAVVNASTTISAQCTSGTDYDISLGQGQNASRRMRLLATANFVDYELYTDAARTVIWPATAGTAPYANIANGASQNYTVYGQIPVQTTPPANATAYTDVVAITVTF